LRIRRLPPVLAAVLLACAPAGVPMSVKAHSAEVDGIKIGHAWAPPAEGADAPVYMPILNDRDEEVTLAEARSPAAERVRLRRVEDGAPVFYDRLNLRAGQPVSLAEWRIHLWLEGLNRTLTEGDRVPVTLTFEPGGTVTIEVVVETGPGH
jgi:hypothetical protein